MRNIETCGAQVGVELAPQGLERLDALARLRLYLQEKSFNSKVSGNELYCTNAVLSLIKVILCSKLHDQNVVN